MFIRILLILIRFLLLSITCQCFLFNGGHLSGGRLSGWRLSVLGGDCLGGDCLGGRLSGGECRGGGMSRGGGGCPGGRLSTEALHVHHYSNKSLHSVINSLNPCRGINSRSLLKISELCTLSRKTFIIGRAVFPQCILDNPKPFFYY